MDLLFNPQPGIHPATILSLLMQCSKSRAVFATKGSGRHSRDRRAKIISPQQLMSLWDTWKP
jgi:hypothetical protein